MGKTFKKDLQSVQLGNLDWTPEKRMESLKSVYQYVTDHAVSAMHWYSAKGKSIHRWWFLFLLSAVFFTFLAILIPLLSQILNENNQFIINPAWESVFVFLAATFVSMDRFFGLSNSRIRFVSTELLIKTKYEYFQIIWQTKLMELQGQVPSVKQTNELLHLCHNFLSTINDIVLEETKEWKQNFKKALEKFDAELNIKLF